MNVSCPQCTSVFRVDPAKVPAGGVRARCSICSGVISVPEPSFEEPVGTASTGGWAGAGGAAASAEWGRVDTPAGGWTPSPPPVAQAPPTSAPSPSTPPQASPGQGGGWQAAPQQPASADWGDWPAQSSPFGAPPDSPLAAQVPTTDPWGSFTGNPLAPEMPTPPYERTSPAAQEVPAASAYEAPAEPAAHDAEVEATIESAPTVQEPLPTEVEAAAPAAEDTSMRSEPAQQAITDVQEPEQPTRSSAPAAAAPAERSQQQPLAGASHVNPYLRRDPHERARRLARALASDIVVYYPDKHAEGLRDGNLRELFREEIKKSYDDYVAQVGADLAQSTTYFQDALNEVLAGGKRLF